MKTQIYEPHKYHALDEAHKKFSDELERNKLIDPQGYNIGLYTRNIDEILFIKNKYGNIKRLNYYQYYFELDNTNLLSKINKFRIIPIESEKKVLLEFFIHDEESNLEIKLNCHYLMAILKDNIIEKILPYEDYLKEIGYCNKLLDKAIIAIDLQLVKTIIETKKGLGNKVPDKYKKMLLLL